ncbi:MAG: hypothetical protein ACRDMX_00960 [Solirubrobacteraceae bacterium]
MTFGTLRTLADVRRADLRRQGAAAQRRRTDAVRVPRAGYRVGRGPRLQQRVGQLLVEAGLALIVRAAGN